MRLFDKATEVAAVLAVLETFLYKIFTNAGILANYFVSFKAIEISWHNRDH